MLFRKRENSHTSQSPDFSKPDLRTSNKGFKHSDPRKEIPSKTPIMASARDVKGDILIYEYDPNATNLADKYKTYKNYKRTDI